MSDYLPLCAFRHGLLPAACRSCAWWQTTESQCLSAQDAGEKRRQWMTNLEGTWGTTGLLLEGGGPATDTATPTVAASISFAPTAAVPRLREFPFGPLPEASALLFCLMVEDGRPRSQAKRVLHKALAELKTRGAEEVYAVAKSSADPDDPAVCRFFPPVFLAGNGFDEVMENGGLMLMRADLRGLLSLVDRFETVVKRMLRNEPTPSPAAWTHRGT